MPIDSASVGAAKPDDSSPKGGGKARLKTLADLDGRTKARQDAEAMRDALIADLGGTDGLTKFQLLQIENVALTAALLRDMQVKALLGEAVDPTRMATCENTLNRTIERVNAGRPTRQGVTPIEITNTRDLARAVLDVLRMAEIEETAAAEHQEASTGHLPPATRTESERPTEPATAPEPDYIYFETDTETVLNNEARVTREDRENGETFWAITDANGMFHRKLRDRAKAIDFARGLPWRQPAPEPRARFTVNGVEVDERPREARVDIDYRRPRVLLSRKQARP